MVNGWDSLCEAGRLAAQNMDQGRWVIGDISLLVAKEYGKNSIDRFAKEINIPVGRVREYRTVCKFWEIQHRQKLLSDHPNLSYSHFRLAMRFKTVEAATAFIEESAANSYTIEQAAVTVKQRLGDPTPPPKLLDAEGTLRHADLETGMVVVKMGEGANLTELQKWRDKEVRIVIYGVESEVSKTPHDNEEKDHS